MHTQDSQDTHTYAHTLMHTRKFEKCQNGQVWCNDANQGVATV